MDSFRCVLLLLLMVAACTAQRTYQRSCDCEYTKDGRCAYTLLLPASSGSGNAQCAMPGKEPEVAARVAQLAANVTELRLGAGDQSRMLNQLQSMLLTQQQSLSTLGGMVKNLPTSGAEARSGGSGLCNACAQVTDSVKAQQQELEVLQRQVTQAQTSLQGLDKSIADLDRKISADDVTVALAAQRKQVLDLQRSLAAAAANASALQGFGCFRRGLLVSGAVRNVTNAAITASSRFNDGHGAQRGRIYTQAEDTLKGAWCASETKMSAGKEEPNAPEEWLQFDLGKPKSVFGVVTKGRSDYGQWVTSYSLNYTDTDPASNKTHWNRYTNVLGEQTVFQGNKDQNQARVNMFWQPIRARYIRVIPLTSDSNKCMRADVIGCLDEH